MNADLVLLGLDAVDDAAETAAGGVDTLLVTMSMGFECGTGESMDEAEEVLDLKIEAGTTAVTRVVAGRGNPRASLGSLEEELASERLGSLELERRVGKGATGFLCKFLKNRGRLIVDGGRGVWRRRSLETGVAGDEERECRGEERDGKAGDESRRWCGGEGGSGDAGRGRRKEEERQRSKKSRGVGVVQDAICLCTPSRPRGG